jgi:hypothetical protein
LGTGQALEEGVVDYYISSGEKGPQTGLRKTYGENGVVDGKISALRPSKQMSRWWLG